MSPRQLTVHLTGLFPPSQSPLAVPMSTSNQTAGPSTDNFSSIFNAALNEYQRVTKKSLDTHPFAAKLDTCQNPDAILIFFRTQAQAFSKFREGDERLMAWLNPTIHILSAFSGMLEEGIGLVRKPREFAHDALKHPVLRHFHLRRLSSPGLASFSGYVLPSVPCRVFDIQSLGCEGCCGES